MQDKYQETCYWTSFTADQQSMAKQVVAWTQCFLAIHINDRCSSFNII